MTRRDIIELEPHDVAHGGYCVARHHGTVVFVLGAVPGERIRAEVTGRRSSLMYATTVEVLVASPDRIPHVWPLAQAQGVGGVDLGHVRLEASRLWKSKVVSDQFSRIAHMDVPVSVESVGNDDARDGLAWRTRVSFIADGRGGLAMHKERTSSLTVVDSMPIAHEEIQAAMAEDSSQSGFRRTPSAMTRVDYVRSSVSGVVRMLSRPHKDTRASRDIYEIVETRFGTWEYLLDARGFWQVHRDAPSTLVDAVYEATGRPDGPIYDLYAGAGLFTLPLAELSHVIAVEGSPAGAASLRFNAHGRGVVCHEGDVVAVLGSIEETVGGVVVMDPPRAGAGRNVIARILFLEPDRIVYVACDPATLARDVRLLVQGGYTLEGLRAFDLFPRTHHVECVATLVRNTRR